MLKNSHMLKLPAGGIGDDSDSDDVRRKYSTSMLGYRRDPPSFRQYVILSDPSPLHRASSTLTDCILTVF